MSKLYFRHGTVGSAKTLNLLAVAHNYDQQGKRVFLIKPRLDTRFGRSKVRSRAGLEREADLLRYLVAQSGRAVPRDELLRQVWGIDPKNIETRTVDMHVAHLRQKLRSNTALVTVRGKGYMLGT